jgi:CheY-like chemotaxis protein
MTSRTILLIDDDSDLLQVVGARCKSVGIDVLHARNLLTATQLLHRCNPDLVCVDVEMPTGNGLKFCEEMAADPRFAHVAIIVLTGRKDEDTIQMCRQIGAHYAFKTADVWATLGPIIEQLLAEAPPARPQTTIGIRPRSLPEHRIPLCPGEAGAGNSNASAIPSPNDATPAASQPQRSRMVIVADDDADLVEMLCSRIESLGCSAVGVNSSLDAVNAIHRSKPEMVILDVNMPTGSGLGVCEMMATDESLRTVPVIILTGCSDEETIRRCHDMLVFYVQKGADVWSRIEPLVREFLHLNDAPTSLESPPSDQDTQLEPMQSQTTYMEQAQDAPCETDLVSTSSESSAISSAEESTLVDAVFAMLGAADDQAANSAEPPHEVVEAPWILSIDDDFDFTDTLKIRLDEYGIAVARAANGMAGYRMAFTTRAQAILLDYQMPNGQGDYILNRLKDNPITRDIPVIMITGVRDHVLERRVMAMGAAAFMQKPVNFERLREELGKYIRELKQSARARKALVAN